MRVLTVVAIALGSLLVGALLGALGVRYGSYDLSMRDRCRMALTAYEMADVEHKSTYVAIQRYQGTPEAYETALKDMLAALDQRERARAVASFRGDGLLFSDNITNADRAFTYARLSLIAAQQSHTDEAATYQSKAVAACARAKWKTCSWDSLATLVQRLDERGRPPQHSEPSSHGS